jgi:hypothetical protein
LARNPANRYRDITNKHSKKRSRKAPTQERW